MPAANRIQLLGASDDWLRRHLRPDELLDDRELARAKRIVIPEASAQFAYARAFLRTALAQALGVKPQAIRLGTGPHGKPFLAGSHWMSGLLFNLSHCPGLTVLAASHDILVGVDSEQPARDIDRYRFAKRFFHPLEKDYLAALPDQEHRQAFFRIWTQKEAWLKAIGVGLDLPLSSFAVTGASGDEAGMAAWDQDPAIHKKWRLHSLGMANCPVTLCGEAGDWSLEVETLL